MSGYDELERVEQLLRATPPPVPVPPGLADAAKHAALGAREEPPVALAPRSRARRPRWARLVPAVAVMAAAAAAALVIGVGGRGDTFDRTSTLSLAGPGGAGATVDFGATDDGSRPVLVHVHDLRPAPAGSYYEMWFQVAGERVSAVTFNTGSSGDATVPTSMPADMHWGKCWVTMERVDGVGEGRVVLRST